MTPPVHAHRFPPTGVLIARSMQVFLTEGLIASVTTAPQRPRRGPQRREVTHDSPVF